MKRKGTLVVAWVCGSALALTLALGMARTGRAQAPQVRYVLRLGGANTGDCTNPNTPCKSIQYAIEQASAGDTIRVGSGPTPAIYEYTVTIDRSLILEGGWSAVQTTPGVYEWRRATPCEAWRTVIDGFGAGRAISIAAHTAPTIDCFTITGGDAEGLGGGPFNADAGGGIYGLDAAPIIVNNVITGNVGCSGCMEHYGRGGGVYLQNAPYTAIISGNRIAYNTAAESIWGQGGGVMLVDSDAQVRGNTIEHNRGGVAGDGGGIMVVGGSPTIADNVFERNTAAGGVMGNGGAICVWSNGPVTIERNRIAHNRAIDGLGDTQLMSHGGGIYFGGNPNLVRTHSQSNPTGMAIIRDNELFYNVAAMLYPHPGQGGGMYLTGLNGASIVSGNVLVGNVAGHNDSGYGGGLCIIDSALTVSDNRIVENQASPGGVLGMGGGVYIEDGEILLHNNVITGNAAGGVFSVGAGGGLCVYSGTHTIAGNTVAANRATWAADRLGSGGGAYLGTASSVWLDGNEFVDNVAAWGSMGRGGGVRIALSPAFTLTNNIIARNTASQYGSGVAIYSSVGTLVHNTIADNSTGDAVGVRVDGSDNDVTLINTIIVSHTVGISNTGTAISLVSADHTLFEANAFDYGAGVSSTNEFPGPALLRPDYRLHPGSNAIDHGLTVAWVTWDIDGGPRPIGVAPDLGANEWRLRLYLPLVLRAASP